MLFIGSKGARGDKGIAEKGKQGNRGLKGTPGLYRKINIYKQYLKELSLGYFTSSIKVKIQYFRPTGKER